jgi:hypothetical protein
VSSFLEDFSPEMNAKARRPLVPVMPIAAYLCYPQLDTPSEVPHIANLIPCINLGHPGNER